ncbi:hypothetical protein EVAR_67791_1 [Eumeta japonica]|uniref:Uncharacterized protein n=1 Tax=Eumeta variegata TaxID=151549 RepID=A0A4C1ZYW1_EUMVA|nr:hypothetical protein EVAR_67791_1 [Eumeta japonica]
MSEKHSVGSIVLLVKIRRLEISGALVARLCVLLKAAEEAALGETNESRESVPPSNEIQAKRRVRGRKQLLAPGRFEPAKVTPDNIVGLGDIKLLPHPVFSLDLAPSEYYWRRDARVTGAGRGRGGARGACPCKLDIFTEDVRLWGSTCCGRAGGFTSEGRRKHRRSELTPRRARPPARTDTRRRAGVRSEDVCGSGAGAAARARATPISENLIQNGDLGVRLRHVFDSFEVKLLYRVGKNLV